MNDEIKEILEFLKPIENRICATLGSKKCELLLDYITNLQKEKEDYKSKVEKAVEYIKNNISWYYDEDLDESIYQDVVNGDDLLNILQNGSEKDG